jgi:hypothetical protein
LRVTQIPFCLQVLGRVFRLLNQSDKRAGFTRRLSERKEKNMRTISLFLLITASCLWADDGANCRDVQGGITTNFIDASDTLGTSTGDLAGGLGVSVLGQSAGANGSIILHVHHHWVTQTGETLSFNDAYATLFPTPVSGFYAASYLDGVEMNENGTGRFKGATGKIYAWGAVDLNRKQLALRYEGELCFARK